LTVPPNPGFTLVITDLIGITPALRKAMGAYDLSPMPKYYVELKGAGHFAWTDLRHTFHDPIVAYSLAFWIVMFAEAPPAAADPKRHLLLPSFATPPDCRRRTRTNGCPSYADTCFIRPWVP
jgi:hypothetical protein